MLDWMKKLLKKEENSATETPQTDHSLITNKYESLQKEIEARVTYQYPRGKFRFPLEINEQVERNETVHTEQVNPSEQGQPSIEQERSSPRSWQREKLEQVRPVPRHVPESKLHQPEGQGFTRSQLPESNRGPFRPTEIASPVFGYTRPDQDKEKRPPVEDIVLSNERKSVVDAWLEKNGYVSVFETKEVIHTDKTDADSEEQVLLSKEYTETACVEKGVAPVTQMKEGAPLNEDSDKEIVQELQRAMQNEMPTELQASKESEIADFAAERDPVAPGPFEEAEAAKEEEGPLEEEKPAEQLVSALPEEAEAAKEEEEPLEEEKPAEQLVSALPEEVEATEGKMEMLAEPQPVKTKERERKRFVPYNVVMLKQDKLHLEQKKKEVPVYTLPPIHLLHVPPRLETNDAEWLQEQKELLNTTFFNFNVGAKVVHMTQGPSVTRFEVQPDPGVKVNKITNLSDDIKLNLAARDIRIEAPIPGKNAVGIEVPNKESKPVFLREILRSPQFAKSESPLTVALGLDISGAPIVTDIRKMPHGLIAGATGSGKSVCINAILTSILYKAMPHEVKLMLIDPKMVELAPYNEVPHLVSPVITDAKAATAALKWAVEEMERRYESFAHAGARDLTRYNDLVGQKQVPGQQLPYIVIVIDELADLMMVAPGDVEEAICRIAQKARACGIHLLVATQRPSVDVITGLIKSNIPTRIAFTVSSQIDSRTIIDTGGAEKLLGRGDMLFLENGTSKTVRLQGVYVSDEEIERTVQHVKQQMNPCYLFQQDDLLAKTEQHAAEDELFYDACQFVLEQGGASASSVQRRFRIGYNRAARLIEEMEAQGIISEARGTKPRDVLITEGELAAMQDLNG